MHPVYISIGNIHKDIRNKPSRQGWMLLAKLPTSKFAALKARLDASESEKDAMPGILAKRLFHRCMHLVLDPLRSMEVTTAVDADGFERRVVAILMAWLADLEEQWMILGLAKSSCPMCLAQTHEFDTPTAQERRTGDSILEDLRATRREYPDADVWQFVRKSVQKGLVGVEELCWEGLPVDMCRVVCVDALHGLHKMFKDHLMKWVSNVVGKSELDVLFMAQPRRTGFRNFHSGISHITQCTGRENRDLERQLLMAIAAIDDLDPRVLRCVRALLDFIFKAGFPLHSDDSIEQMRNDVDVFWANIWIFISLGARVGDSGDIIEHFRIPKLHMLLHYFENIEDLGTVDNYSTEICEALHIPYCKKAYKATNRKEYDEQIIRYLVRLESLQSYTAYLAWRNKNYPEFENDEYDQDDDREETLLALAELNINSLTDEQFPEVCFPCYICSVLSSTRFSARLETSPTTTCHLHRTALCRISTV